MEAASKTKPIQNIPTYPQQSGSVDEHAEGQLANSPSKVSAEQRKATNKIATRVDQNDENP